MLYDGVVGEKCFVVFLLNFRPQQFINYKREATICARIILIFKLEKDVRTNAFLVLKYFQIIKLVFLPSMHNYIYC